MVHGPARRDVKCALNPNLNPSYPGRTKPFFLERTIQATDLIVCGLERDNPTAGVYSRGILTIPPTLSVPIELQHTPYIDSHWLNRMNQLLISSAALNGSSTDLFHGACLTVDAWLISAVIVSVIAMS